MRNSPSLLFGVLGNKGDDIEYWYDSRLPGEAAPIFGRHIHPAKPRALRLTLTHRFR